MASLTATTPELVRKPPDAPPLWTLIRSAASSREGRVGLLGSAGCLGLLGLIFQANLRHLIYMWSTDGNYSHGFLVPLISLYFANEAARRGSLTLRSGVGCGVTLIALAMLGRLATVLVPVGFVGDCAFLIGLAGVVALLAGRDALRRFGFALAFLAFMVPLPVQLYTTLASPLQLLISRAASEVLNLIGIPVLCEGNMMTLPGGVSMFVAEACSGMRQLTGFLALTTAVAYLARRPWWYRLVLVISSVPIAMTANVIRVVATGIIMERFDPKYAAGTFHTVEGLVLMGLGLALLAGECWMLNRLCERRGGNS